MKDANSGCSVQLAAKYGALAMMKTSAEKKYPSGSIICTASVAGLRSNAGSTDYSASKAAVISIAQTTSYQLAGTGVRVNAICPGVIETGMTAIMYDAARARGTEKKIGQVSERFYLSIVFSMARWVKHIDGNLPLNY